MAYLTCKNLAAGYGGMTVVTDVSLSVGSGEAVFIVGENGAGKSTLLKTLMGLQPPQAGTIDFGDGAKAGEVGYLPQRQESQRDFPASAWEVALSGRATRLGLRPFYVRSDKDATRRAMERVNAYELKDKPFGSLSGGQQQRVLLARALALDPLLLVLDEPTTGLDPMATQGLFSVLDALRSEGVGVLAVTHDVVDALPHATRVIQVANGHATPQPADALTSQNGGVA